MNFLKIINITNNSPKYFLFLQPGTPIYSCKIVNVIGIGVQFSTQIVFRETFIYFLLMRELIYDFFRSDF
jgi:hypothetical protein